MIERGLIAERVRAGLRNARAKGKKLGRPRKFADAQDRRPARIGAFLGHNGVRAICESANYDAAKGLLRFKGLSVVNGCQSLSTIYSVSERVRSDEAKGAYH